MTTENTAATPANAPAKGTTWIDDHVPARTKGKGSNKGYKVPDLARAYLQAKGVRAPSDARVDKACKTVRGFMRANKGKLAKSDPAIKRHTKGADWGTLNARTRDSVVKFAKGQFKSD